jgi:hypothetical protein
MQSSIDSFTETICSDKCAEAGKGNPKGGKNQEDLSGFFLARDLTKAEGSQRPQR